MTDSIVDITYFLDNTVSISERVYCILHSIHNIPECVCGEKVKFDQYSTGYRKFCSVKCSSNSTEKKEKIKNTNLEKHGCVNAFQSGAGRLAWDEYISDYSRIDSMKSKIGETLKNNLGVSAVEEAHKIRTEKALKIKIEKYGFNYNNREKANLKRDEKRYKRNCEKPL